MSILVFNAGSSSLKYALYGEATLAEIRIGKLDVSEAEMDGAAVAEVIESVRKMRGEEVRVVGQRVVHGGTKLDRSVLIDASVKAEIERLTELAPLHNPPALKCIEAVASALPGVPQIAVFDTAFYSRLPPVEYTYPVPHEWLTDWGVRRFGFHGISHAFCAGRAAEFLGRDLADMRTITCHLGNGCSATATRGGAAVSTTMGFTPMDGLMMGTRPGSLDPGILLHVQNRHGLTAKELDKILNHESGLKGVSGVSSDYRKVEAAAERGDPRARLALDLYASRIRTAVGALAVSLGGVDALVFTAGIGENSATLRAAACQGLECLGLALDGQRNKAAAPDADISVSDSPSRGRILVLHTREELLIAREALRLVQSL